MHNHTNMPLLMVFNIKINLYSFNCTGGGELNCDLCKTDRVKNNSKCICPNRYYEDNS